LEGKPRRRSEQVDVAVPGGRRRRMPRRARMRIGRLVAQRLRGAVGHMHACRSVVVVAPPSVGPVRLADLIDRAALPPGSSRPAGEVVGFEARCRGHAMNGRVMVLAGGSRGIGEAVAVLAAQRGYEVVLSYARDAARAAAVVNRIEAAGGRA